MKKKAKICNGNNENSEVKIENDITEEEIYQSENINTEEINDGSVRITKEEIDELLYNKSNLKLPPRQEFLYALYGILNHPSIPRYIYSCVVKLINKMLNSPNKELFVGYTFNTSREFVEKEVSNLFSSSIYERLPFLEIDSEGKEKQLSELVFDSKEIIKEEVVHNTNLLFDNRLALKHALTCEQRLCKFKQHQ